MFPEDASEMGSEGLTPHTPGIMVVIYLQSEKRGIELMAFKVKSLRQKTHENDQSFQLCNPLIS